MTRASRTRSSARRAARSRPAARTRRRRRCASSSMRTSAACCSRRSPTSRAAWRWRCTARGWSTSSAPATPRSAAEAGTLLEMLTPIAKSWPSEWALEANSLAIQIHGGYGYTRDFPVEQHWRDNRLNMIHEGTHGIQALDLLGRKAVMQGGAGLKLLAHRIDATIARALAQARHAAHANALAQALQRLGAATRSAWATGDARGRAGQRHALPAGLRPHGAGVAVAGRRRRHRRIAATPDRPPTSGGWPRSTTSCATSCPRTTPGCASSSRATAPAATSPKTPSDRRQRHETR